MILRLLLVRSLEKSDDHISINLKLNISVRFNLTRDISDEEQTAIERFLCLVTVYQLTVHLRKITIHTDSEGPQTNFAIFEPHIFQNSKFPVNMWIDRKYCGLHSVIISVISHDQMSRKLS